MKRFTTILLCIMLLLSLSISTAAQGLPLVIDEAQLLSQSEQELLTEELERIRSEQGMDVVVLTKQSVGDHSAQSYADDYYDHNGYGDNGVLLLVAMEERQWHISTTGRCIDLINVQELADNFLDDLSRGAYYDAFFAFAASCEKAMHVTPDAQEPVITGRQTHAVVKTLLICFAIGLAAGLITVLIMKGKLKTVKYQSYAANYVTEELKLTQKSDLFLYHTTTRRPIPQNNNTHNSSSGRSHGGGGGRF